MSSIYSWSKTAGDNATSDDNINWAEGQAPSTVNNSAREMMARIAELLGDLGGSLEAGGTANAITFTSNSAFTAYVDGLRLSFRASTDNTDAATLNVNSIGAKALRKIAATGDADVEAGDIQAGCVYDVIYSTEINGGTGGWQLMQVALPAVRNDYVPTGSGMDYWGTAAPTGYIFPYGQAVSRTTYANLYAVLGTTYGEGDGSTTFNLPDKRGRASFGKDDMGGTSANRLTGQSGGINGDVLGDTGGAETVTLTTAQIPSHSHGSGTLATGSAGAHTHNVTLSTAASNQGQAGGAGSGTDKNFPTSSAGAHTHTITGSTASAGSGDAHNNLPPGVVCNYIIKT